MGAPFLYSFDSFLYISLDRVEDLYAYKPFHVQDNQSPKLIFVLIDCEVVIAIMLCTFPTELPFLAIVCNYYSVDLGNSLHSLAMAEKATIDF